MVKKVFDDNVVREEQMEKLPLVKQMVRWISAGVNETGDSVYTIDAELGEYAKKGYELFATHYIGTDPLNGIGVLYILVLKT